MTAQIDIYNRALGSFGSRTNVAASEISTPQSNEAIYFNLIYTPFLRRLQRMAPWACCFNAAQLQYITSVYGTPENPLAQATATINGQQVSIWAKGQPSPPWAYEYQYPVDCIRACWLTPQTATGFASGIPITTAVTGGAPTFWQGPPVKFTIGVDQFFNLTGATPVAGGSGYAIGDLVTLALQPAASTVNNIIGAFQAQAPQGAGPVFQVTGIGGGGSITSVVPVSITPTEATPFTGSLFYQYQNPPVAVFSTTGNGTGATFNPTYGVAPSDQRVILTNQEFAILNYVRFVQDPNVWDDAFQEAFVLILGAAGAKQFTGDKTLANLMIAQANTMITEARGDDANEGLKVNDILPDWVRIRGVNFTEDYSGPYDTGFNWGAIWPGFT